MKFREDVFEEREVTMSGKKEVFLKERQREMPSEEIPNHEEKFSEALDYLERRKKIYLSFGYDVEAERLAIIRAAEPFSGAILEAGTGKGHFAVTLARLGFELVSFDCSEEQLRVARENLEKNNLAHLVRLVKEDGEGLSFGDGLFDIVFSVNMVHHLKNTYQVISELIRVLKPGGKLVISDFSPEGLAMMAEVHRLEGDEHEVAEVDLAQVEQFLAQKGFEVARSRTKFQTTLVAKKPEK